MRKQNLCSVSNYILHKLEQKCQLIEKFIKQKNLIAFTDFFLNEISNIYL